jgi:hypothetical protein
VCNDDNRSMQFLIKTGNDQSSVKTNSKHAMSFRQVACMYHLHGIGTKGVLLHPQ